MHNLAPGAAYTSKIDKARTSDTNAYGAGDVIGSSVGAGGAVWEFTNIGEVGGHILITDADLRIDVAAVPSGMTSFRLHLYDASPASALGDNASWDLPAGDRANYLGYIDLGTPVDVGSTLFVQQSGLDKMMKMGASTSLFGYLVTNGAYTPSLGGNKAVRLNALSS